MKVKIISDAAGTRVVNAETGEAIEGVQSINFVHEVGDQSVLMLEIVDAQAEIEDDIEQEQETADEQG